MDLYNSLLPAQIDEYIDFTRNDAFVNKLAPLIDETIIHLKNLSASVKESINLNDPNILEELNDFDKKISADAINRIVDNIKKDDRKNKYDYIRLVEALNVVLLPVFEKVIGYSDLFRQELLDIAPAIIYQPGSRWNPEAETRSSFSQKPKEKYKDVIRELTKGQKKHFQEWRRFCAQTDELGKAELIELAYEMELYPYIRANMTNVKFVTSYRNTLHKSIAAYDCYTIECGLSNSVHYLIH